MKGKSITRRLLSAIICVAICVGMTLTAFAVDIPYANHYTSGTGDFTFYINTKNFSGYDSESIGHFTVQTQGYSSSSYITVTVYYGNNAVGFAWPGSNEKLEDIGFDEFSYFPAGRYRIVVSVTGESSDGWTGVWLYH